MQLKRGSDISEGINFDSYNDSTQALHIKEWVNQQSSQQNDKSKKHSFKEDPQNLSAESDTAFTPGEINPKQHTIM
ncbi:MAG: hypothetical protein CVU90_08820 [Firmicutes bacterium HGW-Firmicutes-15]|nr:MAG: hypothetical protein CVU90_08820 [Firmicutes bacterium HGW-Firmicutes-15]